MENQVNDHTEIRNEFRDELINKIINNKTIYDHTKLLQLLHDTTTSTHTYISYENAEQLIMTKIHKSSGETNSEQIFNQNYNNKHDYKRYHEHDKINYTALYKGSTIQHIIQGIVDNDSIILGDMHNIYDIGDLCDINKITNKTKGRGRIARAIAYFYVRYAEYRAEIEESVLNPQMIVFWNRCEPVDKDELIRESDVYKYQNNHNPFILIPELIEILFCTCIDRDINIHTDDGHYHIPLVDIISTRENFYKKYSENDIEKIKQNIDRLKYQALRNLQSIQNSKTKKEKGKIRKRHKKLRRKLLDLEDELYSFNISVH